MNKRKLLRFFGSVGSGGFPPNIVYYSDDSPVYYEDDSFVYYDI